MDEGVESALALAYSYLNRRDRTEAEVRRRLERDRVPTSVVEAAIDTLRQQRYLDDVRYAALFAQDKRELEQWGRDRIRRALLERGIARERVEDALTAHPPESELDRAIELLRRKFASPPRERRERDRALGMLLRKGYESELAVDALAAYARDRQPGVR